MKHLLKLVFVLTCMTMLSSLSVAAQPQEKMVIALKTNDFELTETDISSLVTGESKTIETVNGKVIDILKTADGAEIYVDGELLDINQPGPGHVVETQVEVICDDEENCDENVIVIDGHDGGFSGWVRGEGDQVLIHKEIVHACNDEDENSSCSDPATWVDKDGDIDLEELHERHGSEGTHKVIVIKKEVSVED